MEIVLGTGCGILEIMAGSVVLVSWTTSKMASKNEIESINQSKVQNAIKLFL